MKQREQIFYTTTMATPQVQTNLRTPLVPLNTGNIKAAIPAP